jgi:hypothetical protein
MSNPLAAKLAKNPMGTLVQRYKALREKRAADKKAWEVIDTEYAEAMDALSVAMLIKLNAEGAESQKTPHGTAYVFPQTTGSIVDFDALWEFIKERDRPELLQRRLTLSEVTSFNETHPDEPVPGVHLETVQTVRVRAK